MTLGTPTKKARARADGEDVEPGGFDLINELPDEILIKVPDNN
jgi:hypothetical protein